MADLLLEIGVEEIPARMLDAARDELRSRVFELLQSELLLAPGNTPEGTPISCRRWSCWI